MITRLIVNSGKCHKYTFLGGSAQIITILHRGVIEIYYNITWGGSSRFITILQWGWGVSRDPKFVLGNIWTAPYNDEDGDVDDDDGDHDGGDDDGDDDDGDYNHVM